ncbi:hypothetical protein C1H46_028020 [Malus baccata]|uniref:Ribosomal protein/NADH dehydrogenase domain-containing protein n=1 Tax=Malus baccata TaxID=106549 RepID=A0A540LIW9_MALBA|nr:hypothetical protein C1H46_028020 [Malus baccata]
MAWRGKLSQNLKEIRVLLCQSSPSSASTRTFVEKNYKDLKSANPKLPILIRECRGIEPQLWARYGGGATTPSPQGIPQASLRLFENLQRGLRLLASFLVFTDSPAAGPNLGLDMGVERGVRLEGLTEPQISKALEELVKVGESLKA